MRRILIVFIIIIAASSSCASLERARMVTEEFVDYRPYTTEGFFISPDPYVGGDYTTIGEYRASILPAWKIGENRTYKSEAIDAAELLRMAVSEAKKRGANGIVDYKVTVSRSSGAVESYDISAILILIHNVELH